MNDNENLELEQSKGQFLVYRAEDGTLKLDVRLEDETVWLTQTLMAELFQTTQQNISQHILNIYEEEELTRRIQDIRTSERRFYQKITDIYATSIDYDPTLDISLDFFKNVQNKMHWQ